jgi:hypothetical protein
MKKSLATSTGGAVYVEFLLAFIPLLFMFLGMVQMGLLYGASLVVQHSSNVAVRAAMVVMDDDPQYYSDEDRMKLDTNRSGPSGFIDQIGGALGGIFRQSSNAQWTGGARLQAIEFAAGMPLLPLSPSLPSILRLPQDESARGALGMDGLDSPEARVAWGIVYNSMAMRVTFPTSAGGTGSYHGDDFQAPSDTGDAGQVIARVTYLYNCQVPLANRLMCEDLFFMRFGIDPGAVATLTRQFLSGSITYDQLQQALQSMQDRSARRTRWTPRLNELGNSLNVLSAAFGISAVLGGPTPRFVPITAEAYMPMQAANYLYHSGHDSTSGRWEQQCMDGDCSSP